MPSVCVVGAGPQGLTLARALKSDGFDVTVLCADRDCGGPWSKDRASPGLHSQSPGVTIELAGLPYTEEERAGWAWDGLLIPATKYNAYLHRYIDTFLGPNSIRYKTKLLHLERDPSHGWLLTVQANGTETQERYDKVALCTGADFTPMIPEALRGLGPDGPLVIHSGDGQPAYERVLKATEGSDKPVLVVGYGKSGVDACVWLVKQGRKVVLNIKKPVFYMGMDHKKPPPMKVVLSRLLTYLWPAREMKTRWEGFLHNTRLGCWLVQAFFGFMYKSSHKLQQLGAGHPLHLDKDAIFWRLQMGGAVPSLPGNFYELVKAGKIQIVGPTHVSAVQGSSVAFENGETLDVAAVIASTGWAHSYIDLFSPEDAHKMGLTNRPASVQVPPRKELYLQRAPAPPNNFDAPLIWHGMIPTDEKSWLEHDIAVGGAIWPGSGNSIWEVTAHFISSWFLEDPFIKVPKTTQEAIQECEVENAYLRQRFPERNLFTMSLPPQYVVFFAFARYVDDLLEKMSLPNYRGATGFIWQAGKFSVRQLATLTEERAALRKEWDAKGKKAL